MYLLKYKGSLVFVLLLCCNIFYGIAQKTDSPGRSKGKPVISPGDFNSFEKDKSSNISDKVLDSLKKTSNYYSNDMPDEYNKAYVKYEIEALDHRHRVFEWQLVSSKYIFVTVIFVVALGLLLSFWQFYLPVYRYNKFLKTAKESETKQVPDENKETPSSSIKLGKDGIEITSPVIGLLILFISIAFFFLYLNYVYPISEIQH